MSVWIADGDGTKRSQVWLMRQRPSRPLSLWDTDMGLTGYRLGGIVAETVVLHPAQGKGIILGFDDGRNTQPFCVDQEIICYSDLGGVKHPPWVVCPCVPRLWLPRGDETSWPPNGRLPL